MAWMAGSTGFTKEALISLPPSFLFNHIYRGWGRGGQQAFSPAEPHRKMGDFDKLNVVTSISLQVSFLLKCTGQAHTAMKGLGVGLEGELLFFHTS